MDSQPNSESEQLSDLTRKHLKINNEMRNVALTNLTAKYNKSKSNKNTLLCDPVSKQSTRSYLTDTKPVALKDRKVTNSFSSDEESSDSEYQGSSLLALAAKHKSNFKSGKSSNVGFEAKGKKSQDLKITDESSDEEFSSPLAALAAKHKVQGRDRKKSTLKTSDVASSSDKQSMAMETELISKCQDKEMSDVFTNSQQKLRNDVITLSDDSDIENLLVSNKSQLQGISKANVLPPDNLSDLKPRELLSVKVFHRQHSKSESDSFSFNNQVISRDLSEKENEISTSLGTLKGSMNSVNNFEFSLGCSIPQSFKSKYAGKPLASSLSNSRDTSFTNLNTSFSDPDVSLSGQRQKVTSPFFALQENKASAENTPNIFGGINLSSAIKTSSRSSIPIDESMEDSNVLEEEEIVTLLDTMNVDEVDSSEAQAKQHSIKPLETCNFSIYSALQVKLKLQTKKCSSFGKVVCKRWKPLPKPYVQKEKVKTSVVPFEFSTPSPDDVISGFLERRRKD